MRGGQGADHRVADVVLGQVNVSEGAITSGDAPAMSESCMGFMPPAQHLGHPRVPQQARMA
jgi:hypothetical protein